MFLCFYPGGWQVRGIMWEGGFADVYCTLAAANFSPAEVCVWSVEIANGIVGVEHSSERFEGVVGWRNEKLFLSSFRHDGGSGGVVVYVENEAGSKLCESMVFELLV